MISKRRAYKSLTKTEKFNKNCKIRNPLAIVASRPKSLHNYFFVLQEGKLTQDILDLAFESPEIIRSYLNK